MASNGQFATAPTRRVARPRHGDESSALESEMGVGTALDCQQPLRCAVLPRTASTATSGPRAAGPSRSVEGLPPPPPPRSGCFAREYETHPPSTNCATKAQRGYGPSETPLSSPRGLFHGTPHTATATAVVVRIVAPFARAVVAAWRKEARRS
ncbi:hypothetical protein M433DRAFT_5432 [Acidomyces richmondensis BFW]|nr:MAG: hypothetical protein FE78DRAFT_33333 [Acidomyces sp. 'richmondensis']KYG44465.1 hypothetical protein M433DRAFT_5432 [Acidomyces richmondensis BFW]